MNVWIVAYIFGELECNTFHFFSTVDWMSPTEFLLQKMVFQLLIIICLYWKCILVWGRVDDFLLFDCLSPFCFLLIKFHCTFFIFVKYHHIMFIIIVFRLSSYMLICGLFYCLSHGISHGMWLLTCRGWMIFHFWLSILFFVN